MIDVPTLNTLTKPSSDVAATFVESWDQQTLVTFAFSENADGAIIHSGLSAFNLFSLRLDSFDVFFDVVDSTLQVKTYPAKIHMCSSILPHLLHPTAIIAIDIGTLTSLYASLRGLRPQL